MKRSSWSIRIVLSAAVVVLSAAPLLSQTDASTLDEAVTYQINPTHTGAIQTKNLAPPLAIRWSVNLHATVGYALIAEGKVFVLAGDSNAGTVNLYGLDGSTGATLWGPIPIPEGAYWWAAAAYDNGTIFVVPDAVQSFNAGAIYAFNASTGTPLWTAVLPGQYLYNSAPTALGGGVFTGGAGGGGTVYAVRESDGSVAWTASVANGNDSSPIVTATGVYVSYVCPQVYRFNPRTGALIWNNNPGCDGGGGSTPSLYNGSLYVLDSLIEANYNGLILNAATGATTGYFNSQATPAFYKGIGIYVEGNLVTAFNAQTSATLWTATPTSGDAYASPAIIVNGVVYVGTSEGNLLGYAVNSGQMVEQINVGAGIAAFDYGNYTNPLPGLSAAEGLLVVPAGDLVVALDKIH
ncbi:MAG TPA: PQQ-binding-like beta-propeller repeat protein [Terriglobales bacterium]|nr:PQQ-binding-like beta-propeller repeat protein [Terriglobales bacterium]